MSSNPLGVVGHKKAVPSADDLISIRLLAENDSDFAYLKKEATLYLKSALTLLNNSPFLRNKFGGDGIPQASVLAELLKQRADTINFQLNVDDMSRQLLAREMKKINMVGQQPIAVPMFQHDGSPYRSPVNVLGLRRQIQNGDLIDNAVEGRKFLNSWGRKFDDDAELAFTDAEVTI